MAPPDEDVSAGSILRELILNQYQAIVLGGAALASLIALNPLPLLVWLGSEMVLLPILDSGPLRRLVARRKLARSRARRPAPNADASDRRAHAAAARSATRRWKSSAGYRGELSEPDRHLAGVPLRAARQARRDSSGISEPADGAAALRANCRRAGRSRRHRGGDRSARAGARGARPARARRGGARGRTSSSNAGCWRRCRRWAAR